MRKIALVLAAVAALTLAGCAHRGHRVHGHVGYDNGGYRPAQVYQPQPYHYDTQRRVDRIHRRAGY